MLQFLDDDHPEVFKCVAGFLEMLINFYWVRLFGIVSVLVDSSVCLLSFNFADVLSAIVAFVAPCKIDTVFTSASGFLSHIKTFLSRSVGKYPRVYDMVAAAGITPSMAWGASACLFVGSDYPAP